MTTAIAMETSKGELQLGLGLGIVLLLIVVLINAMAWVASRAGERFAA
jgi:tungstate transport system permease protein